MLITKSRAGVSTLPDRETDPDAWWALAGLPSAERNASVARIYGAELRGWLEARRHGVLPEGAALSYAAASVDAALWLAEQRRGELAEGLLGNTFADLEHALDAAAPDRDHELACALADVAAELGLLLAARGELGLVEQLLGRCRARFADATLLDG